MSFYNSVKDRVRDEDTDETENENEQGGTMAFDELVKKAEQQDDGDEEEEEQDDTEIEDFSNGGGTGSDDYGDPSTIELNEETEPQAGDGSTAEETGSSTNKSDSEVEIHSDGSVTTPGEKDDAVESSPDVDADEDVVALLQELRNQNDQIISVLRDIRERM